MGPEGTIEGATQLRLFQLVFSSMRSYVQPVDSVKVRSEWLETEHVKCGGELQGQTGVLFAVI